jgi:hypothetical protein
LTSGIQVNPTDLNQTFNQVEYQYPNTNIKDQLDFIFISLQDDLPGLLSENEPVNKLGLKNDLVNNYVQAKFIAIRRLLQGREDLIITLKTDYSGIQVEAGDVIRVSNETYGWTNKLFRVSNVIEEKDAEGNLFASLTGFEYNGSIYDDDLDITDFIPADNTGLQDPNILDQPAPPTVELVEASSIYSLNVTGVVPGAGIVRYLEFNYGTNSDSATHIFKSTATNSNGAPLLANTSYTVNVNDIDDPGNLYWSVTAKNDQVAIRSNSSAIVAWPGSNVSIANTFTSNNANSSGNIITTPPITDNIVGGIITIDSGTGTLVANTVITTIISNTQFTVNPTPSVPLINASINIQVGGIRGFNIGSNTITLLNLDKNLDVKEAIGGTNYSILDVPNNTIIMPIDASANTTRNVPIYITGTTVTSTNFYPWYQGTSSALTGTNGNNYYTANSTSSFNPVGAGVLTVADGEDNWYTAIFDDFAAGTVASDESYFMNYGLSMVSNTANTVVQIAVGIEYSNVGYYEVLADAFHTTTLQANLPQVYEASYSVFGPSVANITSSAILVRNITGSANLIIVKGSLASSKGQIPYF